jgi:putative transposase
MSQAASPSTGRPYGLERTCRMWRVNRSTVYVHRQREKAIRQGCQPAPRKRGPVGPNSDEQLLEKIRKVLTDSPFHGEGHRKVWARLRYAGTRTSKRRVLRLMREHGLLAPQRAGHPHGPKAHDGTIKTEEPNQMWGTDMTTVITTQEGLACVFVAVDHCDSACIGIHAASSGNRFEALQPVRQGVREQFDRFEADAAQGLSLRHDHGSAYMSDDFQSEIAFLGITASPAFVREPEGNGVAERFIRTLKENLLWVRAFNTVEELSLALQEFKRTYNQLWILQDHGYKTPNQLRQEAPARQEAVA